MEILNNLTKYDILNSWRGTRFSNYYICENLSKINIEHKGFTNCTFYHISFDSSVLTDITFKRCCFEECTFLGVTIKKCLFIDCEGKFNNLANSHIKDSSFYNCAMLRRAWWRDSELNAVNFFDSYLTGCNFSKSVLNNVDFKSSDIRNTNFNDAIMNDIQINEATAGYALVCPEEGSFIAFKKAALQLKNGEEEVDIIIKLEIPEDALRSSATTRKCRASKAKVLGFYDFDHNPYELCEDEYVTSNYDRYFTYEIDKTYTIEDFDTNRWRECSTGIHFFMTFDEAVNY